MDKIESHEIVNEEIVNLETYSYVREVRKQLRMSQTEYGEIFGMNKGTISKIENNKLSAGPLFMNITRSLSKLDKNNRESFLNWLQGNI